MIEIALTLAALFIIGATVIIIRERRKRARRERTRQAEEQARIHSERLRKDRQDQTTRVTQNRPAPKDKPTVFDLRDNAKPYTPYKPRPRDNYPQREPGTDLGLTTNPALLYGATGGYNDPTPSSSSSSDCGSSGSSSSSSSSYDGGSSSSFDSGSGGSF